MILNQFWSVKSVRYYRFYIEKWYLTSSLSGIFSKVCSRAWRTQTSVSADSRVAPCLRTQTQTQTRFKFKTADTDADADTLKIKIADTYADVDTLKNRIADTDADTLKY